MTRQIILFFAISLFSFGNIQAQVTLSGVFKDANGELMGDLNINLLDNNEQLISSYYVDCDGAYTINDLDENALYHLEVSKETNPLNGTSTFDLVLMSKHILGVQALNPYLEYAADVNESGSISVIDLVITRMLILGVISEFPDSTRDWFFFKEGNSQPEDTFPIQLTENTSGYNFIGVKKGDVNNSALNCN